MMYEINRDINSTGTEFYYDPVSDGVFVVLHLGSFDDYYLMIKCYLFDDYIKNDFTEEVYWFNIYGKVLLPNFQSALDIYLLTRREY
jgi:hypothetical protein